MRPLEKLLSEKEAAEFLNLSPHTLRGDRVRNNLGIPWVKTAGKVGQRGGRVGYHPAALAEWLERRTVRA